MAALRCVKDEETQVVIEVQIISIHYSYMCINCDSPMQIISTYKLPDTNEIIYHAGVSSTVHISSTSFKVKSIGVQFHEGSEDILLAGLLFDTCCNTISDFSKKDMMFCSSKVKYHHL